MTLAATGAVFIIDVALFMVVIIASLGAGRMAFYKFFVLITLNFLAVFFKLACPSTIFTGAAGKEIENYIKIDHEEIR